MKYYKTDSLKNLILKNKLKRVDIVLVHSKKGIIPKLIRFGTKSYWNHIALIFVIRNIDKGFNNTFVIESETRGVDIHNIYDEYLAHPEKYDIGIKRIKAKWLNNDKQGLVIRKLIRGELLNAIDSNYDYTLLIRIARNILNNLIFSGKLIYSGIRNVKVKQYRNIPLKYICSGFAQYSFYKVIKSLIKKRKFKLKNAHLNDIIFNPLYKKGEPEELLLSTTPEDFARSDNLEWKYIIKNGKVYSVKNNIDVNKILTGDGAGTTR